MTYRGHVLYSPSGHPVDVIYRRAVTTDVITNSDRIQPFLQAVKDQAVCLIGAFCTQIAHNKWLFKILREEPTLSLLTPEEREFVEEHIPYTNLLNENCCSKEQIIAEKDRWLIKPLDSYASKGVFAGCDDTPDQWRKRVETYFNQDYIYQEYCPPYRTENICFVEEPRTFKKYTNMSGLFVYNGTFSGIYSRLSDGGIISSQYNEKAVASLIGRKRPGKKRPGMQKNRLQSLFFTEINKKSHCRPCWNSHPGCNGSFITSHLNQTIIFYLNNRLQSSESGRSDQGLQKPELQHSSGLQQGRNPRSSQ